MRRLAASLIALFLAVPAFAAITGTVMNADGKGIAGARVSVFALELPEARRARLLSASPERVPLVFGQTDAKGAFTLESPKESLLVVEIMASGYAPELRRIERDEEVGALALRRADMKQGRITAGGKPLAGATVVWTSGTDVVAVTDAEGRYSVPDPSKWAYRVTVIHPEHALLDRTRGTLDEKTFGRTLELAMTAGTAYQGTTVAADGKTPVAKAAITVDGWPLATSGDDGTFTIARMPANWTQVEARSGSLLGARARGSKESTIRLTRGAAVSGSVRDGKSGAAIAGAAVRASLSSRFEITSEIATFTDAKGNYTLPAMPPGAYRVMATHPAYAMPMHNITAAAGSRVVRDFSGTQLAKISGVVVDEDKQPVAGAAVTSQAGGDRDMMFMMTRAVRMDESVRSGPDGRFALRVEPSESDVRIAANKRGWPAGRSDALRPAAGEKKTGVVVTIPRGYAISGKVVDRNGNALSGVTVTAREAEQAGGMVRRIVFTGAPTGDEDQVQTAADGTFTLRSKEGTYDFSFRREGYAVKNVRAVQIGNAAKPVEATLDPGVEIAGRVTRNGAGVEGVQISSFMTGEMVRATTAADGSFRISDLTPGAIMFNISKGEDFINETRNITAPAADVQIELPPGGRVTGRVTDKATGQPVTTFQAGLSGARSGGGMTFMGPPQLRSFTSDDGTFTLDNVPAGATQIIVQSAGYTTARTPNLTVEEGKTVEGVEVQLDTGVKLTGKVTTPEGTAVSGATVRLDTMPGGRGMRMVGMDVAATTDASGEYVLETLEPGEKTFQIAAQGYLTATKTIELKGKDQRLDVQLSSGQRVSGVVVTDSGAPVADAAVRASSAAAGGMFSGQSARTDANGNFTIEGLAPGRYVFNASKSGYAEGTVRDFDIAAGTPVRITLSSGGVIYGHVSGIAENEHAATTVEARGANGSASAALDPSGNYRIEGAPTGSVRVSATVMRGFQQRRSSAPKSVQLEPGGSVQLDLEFSGQTSVSGRVTRNNRPMSNAAVAFYPRGGAAQTSANTTTDENGVYTISGLEDGQYNVSVIDMQRMAPYQTTFEVRGSGTFDIDMKTSSLRGRVIDATTNEPLADARVQIRAADPQEAMFPRVITTDPAGTFLMESVSPGRYVVTADKERFGAKAVDVTVGDSAPQDLEFQLERAEGVRLTVVDARDGRMLAAQMQVTDMQGRVMDNTGFRFGGGAEPVQLSLAPGQYRVTVGAMELATQTVIVQSPGARTVALTPGGTLLIHSRNSTRLSGRLLDSTGQIYLRGPFRQQMFGVEPSPHPTMLRNIAPGTYTLQLLGEGEAVVGTTQVTVTEGGTADVSL
ncbi:MAG TPA: carboxypeptidase-like regulatory domain-containing protein [Thermoanaerobaculia bacterium]